MVMPGPNRVDILTRLNPAVIARYGVGACRTIVATYTDPTAAFSVQSTSSPADYTYTAAGVTSVIPNTITAQVTFTKKGQPMPLTVHLSRTNAGKLTWYTDCSPLGATDPLVTAMQAFAGHYSGQWNNTTFGTTGTVDSVMTVDAATKTVHVRLTVTGNALGAAAPLPEDLTFTLVTPAVPFTSQLLGPVTVTLQADGSIVADAPNVPSATVSTFRATVVPSNGAMNGSYTVGLRSGATAQGTFTLTRQTS